MTRKSKKSFRFVKIYVFLCACCFLSFCQKNQTTKIAQQKLVKKLNACKHKTPNEIYDTLGEPDEYNAVINSKRDIIKGIITYKYLYNFETKKYDCEIRLITDKDQEEVVDYEYSSEKCYSIITD